VPYKRLPVIARAFAELPDRTLLVAGTGPEAAAARKAAPANVRFEGEVTRERLRDLMRGARAFVFAAEEDFGIVPVEAQACGTPVIAYGRGGARETVRAQTEPKPTGVLFPEQSADAIAEAVKRFEAARFDAADCRAQAERFSARRFDDAISSYVDDRWRDFRNARG
jgi:glycosyltransferase involved in cell wall biosynthesis